MAFQIGANNLPNTTQQLEAGPVSGVVVDK